MGHMKTGLINKKNLLEQFCHPICTETDHCEVVPFDILESKSQNSCQLYSHITDISILPNIHEFKMTQNIENICFKSQDIPLKIPIVQR